MCMSLAAPPKAIKRKNKALMLILSRTLQVNQFYLYLSIEFKYEIFREVINLPI